MPRTDVTVQEVPNGGLTRTFAAPAAAVDGNMYPADGKCWLEVKNTGTQKTLTIQTPGTVDGLAIADRAITIPATTGDVTVPPLPPSQYAQADGKTYVDLDVITGVTICVWRAA